MDQQCRSLLIGVAIDLSAWFFYSFNGFFVYSAFISLKCFTDYLARHRAINRSLSQMYSVQPNQVSIHQEGLFFLILFILARYVVVCPFLFVCIFLRFTLFFQINAVTNGDAELLVASCTGDEKQ